MVGIVLTHGKAAEVTARHLPNWLAVFDEVYLISPADDPAPNSLIMGTSERAGRGALERLILAATMASRFPAAAVLEYDALLFFEPVAGRVAENLLICSEVYRNQDAHFSSNHYGHCPWVATGETWWKILRAGAGWEAGFPDRWLSAACLHAGVQLASFDGFSSDIPWTDEIREEACKVIAGGGRVVHGVKTQRDFEQLTEAARKA